MNIIEPCCAERQLCGLLRESKDRAVLFQTNGDLTLEHLMKAVMLMSGGVRPRMMTLAVPVFTSEMMRVVGRFLRLEWVKTLRLMTNGQLAQGDIQQLADYTGCIVNALTERVDFAADKNMQGGLLAFSGVDGMVVVQGRIYDKVTPGLSLYAGVYGPADGAGVRSVMDAWNALFRARKYTINATATAKKETIRKKTKKHETESIKAVAGTPRTEAEAE